MNRKSRYIISILVIVILTTIFFLQYSKTLIPDKIRATWLWHTEQIIEKPDEILAFLSEKKVDVLFLQINRDIPTADYKTFLDKATTKGISVHALGGSSSWLSDKNGQEKRIAFYKWIENYQQTATPKARFSGIHLDVEPYLRDSWKTDYEGTVAAYQTVVNEGQQVAKDLELFYGIDIPFWFDNRFYNNEFGKGTLFEWLIDNSDQITIMAYRNKAQGKNGIINLAEQELKYATTKEKSVLIGIETDKSSEGDYLSFYSQDESYLNRELVKTERALKTSTSFEGFAIHSIDSWLKMK